MSLSKEMKELQQKADDLRKAFRNREYSNQAESSKLQNDIFKADEDIENQSIIEQGRPSNLICRQFVYDHIKKHPDLVLDIFCPETEKDKKEILDEALNIENWGSASSRLLEEDDFEYCSYVPKDAIFVRQFYCDKFEGQVAFNIYERKDGSFIFGDYSGD